jgi:hypothetical protein
MQSASSLEFVISHPAKDLPLASIINYFGTHISVRPPFSFTRKILIISSEVLTAVVMKYSLS